MATGSNRAAHPQVTIAPFSGSYRDFFRRQVFPLLPSERSALDWDNSINTYLANSPDLFVVRKHSPFALRGFRYTDKGRAVVCSDNEAALWAYMECYLRKSAPNFRRVIQEQAFPIAFCYKTEERKAAFWRNTGRVHKQFSKGKWKLAHILPCAPRELSLEKRMLRLLSPLNHFPFPSSRHFRMSKPWEENREALNIVLYMLAHELGSISRREAFQHFVKAAGGEIPSSNPGDFEIDVVSDPQRSKRFLDPVLVAQKGEPATVPSTDDSFYSLPKVKKSESISFDEFTRRLMAWVKNTDEDIICNGNAKHNQSRWIWTRYQGHSLYLNSDSTRQGVMDFCRLYRPSGRLRVIRNRDRKKDPPQRKINKVVIRGYEALAGFFLYTEQHFDFEQDLVSCN